MATRNRIRPRLDFHDFIPAQPSVITEASWIERDRLAALRAVLEVHRGAQYLGEPGDATCPHDDDYDGDRHFESADGYWLCEDTAAGDFYCVGCRDEEGDPIAYPCPTVTAITEALEER